MLDEMPKLNDSKFAIILEYGEFWSVLLGHFIKHKPPISEEWGTQSVIFVIQKRTVIKWWCSLLDNEHD